jgi:hypothetical protein
MFPYDPELLAAVRTTPQSISDVLQTMRTIGTTCINGDGLKWFNWLYCEVTDAVEKRITSGGFVDGPWLAELDVQFARLYFGALEAELSGKFVPECWKALFDRGQQAATARIQFALAGINAHINHDLPQAIVATCQTTGIIPQHGSVQYDDYTALNTTLDSLIESAKQTLFVRLLGDPLPAVSHLEDTIAAWSIGAAREAAWQNTEVLWHLRATPPLFSKFCRYT